MKNEFDLNKLKNVVLQFKIPLAFDLLNSLHKEDEGEPFIVTIENIPAKIQFKRIYDFRYKKDFDIAKCSKITEDRSGLLSYTEIQVWFDSKMINSPKINKDIITINAEQFVQNSINYLNRFIHIYKVVTNQFWLRQIVKKDLFNYTYILIDTNGNYSTIHTLIPSHHILECNGGKDFDLDDEQNQMLRRLSSSNYFNLRSELHFHMLDNFALGFYNQAILQASTLFENYLYSELKRKLSNTKLNTIKRKEKCGCLVGISEVCEKGILEYFDYDFASTEEWKNYKKYTLTIRNKIIHGELLEPISFEKCELAIDSMELATEILSKNVFN